MRPSGALKIASRFCNTRLTASPVKDGSVSFPAFRAMVETLIEYVPRGQRENARAAAVAVGMGYAFERAQRGHRDETLQRRKQCDGDGPAA